MSDELNRSREYGFPSGLDKPYFLFNNDSQLKAHPEYIAAKAGDKIAALKLVSDLALNFLIDTISNLPQDVIYVAPFAREAAGDNAIPQVLSAVCAKISGATVDNEIVQVTRVFHTGADPMERLITRAQFEGQVISAKAYVLVDDVINMGGTLAELSNYVQTLGGRVVAVIAIVNAGRIKGLCSTPVIIKKLQERYQDEIDNIFGIKPNALTANEAQYLIGFRTADEIRGRVTKAREEIHLRLRSKGIFYENASQSSYKEHD